MNSPPSQNVDLVCLAASTGSERTVRQSQGCSLSLKKEENIHSHTLLNFFPSQYSQDSMSKTSRLVEITRAHTQVWRNCEKKKKQYYQYTYQNMTTASTGPVRMHPLHANTLRPFTSDSPLHKEDEGEKGGREEE